MRSFPLENSVETWYCRATIVYDIQNLKKRTGGFHHARHRKNLGQEQRQSRGPHRRDRDRQGRFCRDQRPLSPDGSSPLLYSPEKSAFRRMAVICTRTGMAFFKLCIVWCASIGSEIPAFPDGKTGILLFFYLRISFPKYRVKHFRNGISYTIFVVLHKKDV